MLKLQAWLWSQRRFESQRVPEATSALKALRLDSACAVEPPLRHATALASVEGHIGAVAPPVGPPVLRAERGPGCGKLWRTSSSRPAWVARGSRLGSSHTTGPRALASAHHGQVLLLRGITQALRSAPSPPSPPSPPCTKPRHLAARQCGLAFRCHGLEQPDPRAVREECVRLEPGLFDRR